MEKDLTLSLVPAGQSPHPLTGELKSRLNPSNPEVISDRGAEHLNAAHKAL